MNSKALHMVTFLLLVVGGLNWLLIGVADFNLVTTIFGEGNITKAVYILVGLSAEDEAGRAVASEHDRQPAGPVVVVGHRVAVRPRHRDDHEISHDGLAQVDAVDESITGLAMSSDE